MYEKIMQLRKQKKNLAEMLGKDIVDSLDIGDGKRTYFIKKEYQVSDPGKPLELGLMNDVFQAQLLEIAIPGVTRQEALDYMCSSIENYCRLDEMRTAFQEKEFGKQGADERWASKVDEWREEIKSEMKRLAPIGSIIVDEVGYWLREEKGWKCYFPDGTEQGSFTGSAFKAPEGELKLKK